MIGTTGLVDSVRTIFIRRSEANTYSDQTNNIFTVLNVFVDVDGERSAHHGIDKESWEFLLILVFILCILRLWWCSLYASRTTWCHGSCPRKNYLSAVVVGVLLVLPTPKVHTLNFRRSFKCRGPPSHLDPTFASIRLRQSTPCQILISHQR